MKMPESNSKNDDDKCINNPNDDGCVLGTAGRDEDPNKAADWHAERDAAGRKQMPAEAHGMPGYPKNTAEDKRRSPDSRLPQNGEADLGFESPEQENDQSA